TKCINNTFLSIYLQYLGRVDSIVKNDEIIPVAFRCTIYSLFEHKYDIFQQLQYLYSLSKTSYGFDAFIPCSILFRTPFYLLNNDEENSGCNSINNQDFDDSINNNNDIVNNGDKHVNNLKNKKKNLTVADIINDIQIEDNAGDWKQTESIDIVEISEDEAS